MWTQISWLLFVFAISPFIEFPYWSLISIYLHLSQTSPTHQYRRETKLYILLLLLVRKQDTWRSIEHHLSSSGSMEADGAEWGYRDVQSHLFYILPLHQQVLIGRVDRVVLTVINHKLAAEYEQHFSNKENLVFIRFNRYREHVQSLNVQMLALNFSNLRAYLACR